MDGIRRLSAVMFTDIQGYTELVSQDEERALGFVRTHREALTELTGRHGGEVIEFYGDGSLSIYDSAVEAVLCAIAMQKIYRSRENQIPVRIGIHLGDIVRRDDTIFGNGVNVASRIESIGVAGSVLVSGQVEAELHNQANISTAFLGKFKFKNVEGSIPIHGIRHPDVLLPRKNSLGGKKGKRVDNRKTLFFIGLFLVIAITVFIVGRNIFIHSTHDVVTSKIAVPPFKNFTGDDDLDFIGDMAAHWLTKELMQTEAANVLAFYSKDEIEELAIASPGSENNQRFAERQGAINVLDGTYSLRSTDSIEFSAFIRHLHNGVVEHAFESVIVANNEPAKGIGLLASQVKGYWETQGEKLISVPTFESYKKYMQARNANVKNDTLATSLLLSAIQLDSSFLDPYFLLTSIYLNNNLYEDAERLLNKLEKMTSDMTAFEHNILNYSRADLNGQNIQTYQIAMKDESQFDRDYFTMTDYLVYSLGYVNNPTKTIELFNKHDFIDMDLSRCSYCIYSHLLGVAAYIRKEKYDKAKELLDGVPTTERSLFYYSLYIKLSAHKGDLTLLEEIVDEANSTLQGSAADMIEYIASRELTLGGHPGAAADYAHQLLESRPTDEELMARGFYLLNQLDSAAHYFELVYAEDKENIKILGQIGVIHAKLGLEKQAMEVINRLDQLKDAYQFGAVPYAQARILLALDRQNDALQSLQMAFDEGAKFSINNMFEQDVDLMPLFSHSSFKTIANPVLKN